MREDDAVGVGDEIVVYAARTATTGEVRLLTRTGGIVIVDKPAELPTTPDRRGERSVIGDAAGLLWCDASEVHAASRLDVGVSGVVLCAVGERAQRHVAKMRSEGKIKRIYVGIAGGEILGDGVWDAPIGRASTGGRGGAGRGGAGGGGAGRSRPVAGGKDAEPAATRYRAIAWGRAVSPRGPARTTLVRFEPVTGRMHQIRVHAAAAGAPLLGDREHGGARSLVDASGKVVALGRIVLHALHVSLPGERGDTIEAVSAVPEDLRAIWKALDGDAAAWDDLAPPAV